MIASSSASCVMPMHATIRELLLEHVSVIPFQPVLTTLATSWVHTRVLSDVKEEAAGSSVPRHTKNRIKICMILCR